MRRRDTPESMAIRQQYRDDNPDCEVTAFLRRAKKAATWRDEDQIVGWQIGTKVRVDYRPAQLHHICGGTGGRQDVLSNLIVIEAAWHDWIHANPSQGTLLCLCAKHAKGEVDSDEFRECSGFLLPGWLSIHADDVPAWMRSRYVRLLGDVT